MWAKLSDAELVEQSAAIVVAELVGETRMALPGGRGELRLGVLRIDERFKLPADSESVSHLLLVLPDAAKPRTGEDLSFRLGQKGVWFLREREAGSAGL